MNGSGLDTGFCWLAVPVPVFPIVISPPLLFLANIRGSIHLGTGQWLNQYLGSRCDRDLSRLRPGLRSRSIRFPASGHSSVLFLLAPLSLLVLGSRYRRRIFRAGGGFCKGELWRGIGREVCLFDVRIRSGGRERGASEGEFDLSGIFILLFGHGCTSRGVGQLRVGKRKRTDV